MFTTIYRPKTPTDFVGNKIAFDSLTSWLLKWTPDDKKNKCALIFGLCGIGKSLVAEMVVLDQYNYNIINVGLDVDRNKDYLNNVIKPLIKIKTTIDGKHNVLVVSDIDSGNDYGFIATLTECIKESQIPIICICDNRYDQNIKPILNYCLDIKMTRPSYPEVYRLMNRVILAEKLRIKEHEIKDLYEQSNGDIRFMLNTLQFGLIKNKKNIQSANIFETTASLFSMDETIDSKYETYWAANDLHPLMIHENYISNTFCVKDEVKKMDNLAYSADALADADLFETRINMYANWEFGPYVGTSTIQATSVCNKKTMIKFPQFLGRISLMNKNKREKMNYEKVSFFEKEINVKSGKALKEKVIKEKVIKEKVIKEKVIKEKVIKEKVIKEKVIKEKVIKEKVIKEKVVKEKVVKEKVVK
jgi:replication factor C subunit 1